MALKFRSRDTFLLLAFGLFYVFTRFLFLGDKPYHHDESIHAIESWRYATQGVYKFNPMLHGPFLYHLQAAIFEILPINDWTGRLSVALTGILMTTTGFLFLRESSKSSAYTWLALVCLSPIYGYYSRTLIMDIPMAALVMTLLWTSARFWATRSNGYLYAAAATFALMVCTKLNSLFYAFAFLSFAVVWAVWKRKVDEISFGDQRRSVAATVRSLRVPMVWSVLLMALIFCALYSSLGRNAGGILDGLYREMIPYWVRQHAIQRIKGPFDYYFPILATYELPLLLSLAWCIWRAIRSTADTSYRAGLWCLGTFILWGLLLKSWETVGPYGSKVHLDQPMHVAILCLEIGSWILLLSTHLRRNEILPAFCAHWGIVSLLLYSYAGEKVPWLTTHILLPWTVYIALVLPELVRGRIVSPIPRAGIGAALILFAGWQGVITVRASFAGAADPRERLVYTHTSTELLELVQRIHHLGGVTGEKANLKVQVVEDSAWPLYWYLRNYNGWFRHEIHVDEQPSVIVMNWGKHEELLRRLPTSYEVRKVKLREWWVPDNNKLSFPALIRYYFTREVYSPLGSFDLALFVRADRFVLWNGMPEKP
ncbi:MAG TPA: flippase activity-associated protein Agl23 [Bdellovibrionota bacterium]|nr:flippase activity-associated protein Agl23 [Bdellovibrionota bacterium]